MGAACPDRPFQPTRDRPSRDQTRLTIYRCRVHPSRGPREKAGGGQEHGLGRGNTERTMFCADDGGRVLAGVRAIRVRGALPEQFVATASLTAAPRASSSRHNSPWSRGRFPSTGSPFTFMVGKARRNRSVRSRGPTASWKTREAVRRTEPVPICSPPFCEETSGRSYGSDCRRDARLQSFAAATRERFRAPAAPAASS
jgi:hypothetical protein